MVVTPVSCSIIYALVKRYELYGAAIGVAISHWMTLGGLVLYIMFIDGKSCWGGFSSEAWKNWYGFIRLGKYCPINQ